MSQPSKKFNLESLNEFKCDLSRLILAVTLKLPQFPHLRMDVKRVIICLWLGGLQAYVWNLQAIISDLRPPAATANTITKKRAKLHWDQGRP